MLILPRLEPELVEVVKNTVRENKLWQTKNTDVGLQDVVDQLCEYYHIDGEFRPIVILDEYNYYRRDANMIGVDKISLVSLLHEYRHFLQHHNLGSKVMSTTELVMLEYDAQFWALSVFYHAFPKMFDKAWSEGKLMAPVYDGEVQLSENADMLF